MMFTMLYKSYWICKIQNHWKIHKKKVEMKKADGLKCCKGWIGSAEQTSCSYIQNMFAKYQQCPDLSVL